MTNRERILAILAGRPPDRIPWIPRPEIWYDARRLQGTLPAKYQGWSLAEIRRDLGMGVWANIPVHRTELRGVEVRTHTAGEEIRTEYITPQGTVSTLYRRSEKLARLGMIGQTVEKMVKGPDDYAAVAYLIEHTDVLPDYGPFLDAERDMGDEGLPMTASALDPLSELLLNLAGYEAGYYHLVDYPRQVEHLMHVLQEHAARIQQVAIESPAQMIMSGSHFSPMMTPPRVFRQHMLVFYQDFAERVHRAGKCHVCHADAETGVLLELLVEAGFDLMDSFVTAPMVPTTLERAREVFGGRVIIWGGLPSTLLCEPATDEEFEAYMRYLFRAIAPGKAFILAVADNIMLESKVERLERVRDMLELYGAYPVTGDAQSAGGEIAV